MSTLDEVLARARGLIGRWEDEDCGTVTVKDFCRYAAALNDVDYIRRARARRPRVRRSRLPPCSSRRP